MVYTNRGVPDPPNNNSPDYNVSPNNEIIAVTDSDSDNEVNSYEGYQPLPGNAEEAFSEEEEDSNEEEGAVALPPGNDLPAIVTMEQSLLKGVWNSGLAKDIEMDSTKVDAVKKAMVNIKLPSTSIPEWASSVPEEEWKALLLNRIQAFSKEN